MVSVKRLFQVALLAVAGFTISLTRSAADRTNAKLDSLSKSNAIGLFTAMQNDQIEVQFIPKSSKQATILIRNNTKKPLATGTSASLGATSRFWDQEIGKSYFWDHFRSKSQFSPKFRKIHLYRTRARRGRKPFIMLVKSDLFGRSESRKVTFGAKK